MFPSIVNSIITSYSYDVLSELVEPVRNEEQKVFPGEYGNGCWIPKCHDGIFRGVSYEPLKKLYATNITDDNCCRHLPDTWPSPDKQWVIKLSKDSYWIEVCHRSSFNAMRQVTTDGMSPCNRNICVCWSICSSFALIYQRLPIGIGITRISFNNSFIQ